MKKLFILLSSVAMIFTMATTAFAEDQDQVPTETFDVFKYKEVADNEETTDVDESENTGYYLGEEKADKNKDYLEFDESETGNAYPYVDENTNQANIGTSIEIVVNALNGNNVETMDPELTYSYLIEWQDMVFTYNYNGADVTRVWDAKTKSYKVEGTPGEISKIEGWNKKTADISIESHCVQTIYDDTLPYANATICLSKESNPYAENNESGTILNNTKDGVKLSLVAKNGYDNMEDIEKLESKIKINNFINIMEATFPNRDFSKMKLADIFSKDNVEELYNKSDRAALRSKWTSVKYLYEDIEIAIIEAYGDEENNSLSDIDATYAQVRNEVAAKAFTILDDEAYIAVFTAAQGAAEYAKVTFSVNVGDGIDANKTTDEPAGDCELHYYAVVTVGL